ncbi:MAG: sulfite exporter TauE/SafE family protein [Pseudomonadota bacterium]
MYEVLSNPANLFIAIAGAFFVGLSKGGLPGAGALTVWLYAHIFGAKQSVAILLPLLICADLYAFIIYRRYTNWTLFKQLAPALVMGAVLGAVLFSWISEQLFTRLIGLIILMVVALRLAPKRQGREGKGNQLQEHFIVAQAFSFFSGLINMLSNAGSPLMAYYLIGKNLGKFNFLGTYVALITVSNLASLPLHLTIHSVGMSDLPYSFGLGVLTIFGVLAARWVVGIIPQRQYEYFILAVVALAGIELLI